jgi:hypothetical protein
MSGCSVGSSSTAAVVPLIGLLVVHPFAKNTINSTWVWMRIFFHAGTADPRRVTSPRRQYHMVHDLAILSLAESYSFSVPIQQAIWQAEHFGY